MTLKLNKLLEAHVHGKFYQLSSAVYESSRANGKQVI